MMQFADVTDLEARWRTLTLDEAATATALLTDASALLSSMVRIDGRDADYEYLLKIVCVNMVKRAMASVETGLYGVSQQSMTAGPYTQQASYSNPTGELYLTKSEKVMLGIKNGYIGSIRAKVRPSCMA